MKRRSAVRTTALQRLTSFGRRGRTHTIGQLPVICLSGTLTDLVDLAPRAWDGVVGARELCRLFEELNIGARWLAQRLQRMLFKKDTRILKERDL